MEYYDKYLKYKLKYLRVKGGSSLNVFASGNTNPCGVYIFARDGAHTYLGCVRKAYANSRIGYKSKALTGAAGTLPKWYGKWTSIGGGYKQKPGTPYKTPLQRAISELNDETNILNKLSKKFSTQNVYMEWYNHIQSDSPTKTLQCHFAQEINGTNIFIIEMRNLYDFFSLFTKKGYTSQELCTSSQGEIDAIQSFTINEIITLQNNEVNSSGASSSSSVSSGNNYFTSYFLTNLISHIIPKLCTIIGDGFATTYCSHTSKKINYITDINPRTPSEHLHAVYQ